MSTHQKINSAVYEGTIRHRRFVPVKNAFKYKLYMLYLDLDEVEDLFGNKWFSGFNQFNLVSFMRKDYFQPNNINLKQAIVKEVVKYANSNGVKLPDINKVCVLTHARYFNIIFNPVSFYYCFDNKGNLQAVLSEITNTPWGERHHYILLANNSTTDIEHTKIGDKHHRFNFDKQFHVSPFNPMDMTYHWVLSAPEERLHIHMDNTVEHQGQEKHFDATLVMNKREWNAYFPKSVIQYPFMTVKVIAGIYWQAMKLWLKKAPFYDHPNTQAASINK